MKICILVGTRPEIIKFYSLIEEIQKDGYFDLTIVHSGQHYDYEMSQVFFEELRIPEPDMYLNVRPNSTHGEQTAQILSNFEKILLENNFDVVLVLGDTNTALSGSLASAKYGTPVGHVESGCRSFDMSMPEEINRILVDHMAEYCFAPSYTSFLNLLSEGIMQEKAFLSGDTLEETFKKCVNLAKSIDLSNQLDVPIPDEFGIVTIHRQENTDNSNRLRNILESLSEVEYPILFPLHPRTKNRVEMYGLEKLLRAKNIIIVPPLGYLSFLRAVEDSKFVLTDSGGVQVEASLMKKPTLTFRENTEWPETIWAGYNHLVGAKKELIVETIRKIFKNEKKNYSDIRNFFPKYKASKRITEILEYGRKNQTTNVKQNKSDLSTMIGKGYPLPNLVLAANGEPKDLTTVSKMMLIFDASGNPIVLDESNENNPYMISKSNNRFFLVTRRFYQKAPPFTVMSPRAKDGQT